MDQAEKRLPRLHELSRSHCDARRSGSFRLLIVLRLAVAITAQPTAEFVRQLGYKQDVVGDGTCALLLAIPPDRLTGGWCTAPPCYSPCVENLKTALNIRGQACCGQPFARLGVDLEKGTALLAPRIGFHIPSALCGVFFYESIGQLRSSRIVHVDASAMIRWVQAPSDGTSYKRVLERVKPAAGLHVCTAAGWLSMVRLTEGHSQYSRAPSGSPHWSVVYSLIELDLPWLAQKIPASAPGPLDPFRIYPDAVDHDIETAISKLDVHTSSRSKLLARQAAKQWKLHLLSLPKLPGPVSSTEVRGSQALTLTLTLTLTLVPSFWHAPPSVQTCHAPLSVQTCASYCVKRRRVHASRRWASTSWSKLRSWKSELERHSGQLSASALSSPTQMHLPHHRPPECPSSRTRSWVRTGGTA